jgi:hypothetical protein
LSTSQIGPILEHRPDPLIVDSIRPPPTEEICERQMHEQIAHRRRIGHAGIVERRERPSVTELELLGLTGAHLAIRNRARLEQGLQIRPRNIQKISRLLCCDFSMHRSEPCDASKYEITLSGVSC